MISAVGHNGQSVEFVELACAGSTDSNRSGTGQFRGFSMLGGWGAHAKATLLVAEGLRF